MALLSNAEDDTIYISSQNLFTEFHAYLCLVSIFLSVWETHENLVRARLSPWFLLPP
jgi:hypothetical protein